PRRAALGIAAAVSKPIRESALFDAIETALQAPAAGGPQRVSSAAVRPAPAPSQPLRILLIEDNPVNQVVTRRLLEREGHTVFVAENGLRGLEAVSRESFDAILMDVQMPGMDGIETTKAIRSRERPGAHRIPIVAFTAHAMKEDRDRCMAAGMDAYLAKPVETSAMLEALENAVAASREHAASWVASHAAAVPQGTPVAPVPPAPEPPQIVSLRRIVGGDEKLLREVVHVFLEDAPAKLSALAVALAAQDPNALALAAHGLKGSSAALGARAATDAAAHLEALARARNLAEADIAASQVKEEVMTVRDALASWLG
ncbi:MAG TPA: response regulator, partial [Candidatus Acidoferrales bacterium]|nr:response regulator [Candidatus Acidoferrales bacterium]